MVANLRTGESLLGSGLHLMIKVNRCRCRAGGSGQDKGLKPSVLMLPGKPLKK